MDAGGAVTGAQHLVGCKETVIHHQVWPVWVLVRVCACVWVGGWVGVRGCVYVGVCGWVWGCGEVWVWVYVCVEGKGGGGDN